MKAAKAILTSSTQDSCGNAASEPERIAYSLSYPERLMLVQSLTLLGAARRPIVLNSTND
jgi:hypothetical protein